MDALPLYGAFGIVVSFALVMLALVRRSEFRDKAERTGEKK